MNAHIGVLPGMSGHADRDGLLEWLGGLERPPKAVFVNHGEDTVCDTFARTIQDTFGYTAYAPYSGTCFDLLREEFDVVTEGVPIVKDRTAKDKARQAFTELVAAAKALLETVKTLAGRSNKELRGYTAEIKALTEKMER